MGVNVPFLAVDLHVCCPTPHNMIKVSIVTRITLMTLFKAKGAVYVQVECIVHSFSPLQALVVSPLIELTLELSYFTYTTHDFLRNRNEGRLPVMYFDDLRGESASHNSWAE